MIILQLSTRCEGICDVFEHKHYCFGCGVRFSALSMMLDTCKAESSRVQLWQKGVGLVQGIAISTALCLHSYFSMEKNYNKGKLH
jgi:hypothetical protein